MFGEANDSSIWGASWFLRWVVVGGLVNCWDVLFCSDWVYHQREFGHDECFCVDCLWNWSRNGFEDLYSFLDLNTSRSCTVTVGNTVHDSNVGISSQPCLFTCLPEDTLRVSLPWTTMAPQKDMESHQLRAAFFKQTFWSSKKYNHPIIFRFQVPTTISLFMFVCPCYFPCWRWVLPLFKVIFVWNKSLHRGKDW